ncbi:MAG: DUF3040 domain-containing protein [Acidimicrobiales bacterium]|nr:DUF3040 domain-containing protein [Acidimicrobiales bacterium]
MPLSDEEQRILHEMEQNLYHEDRDFVDRVGSETVYKHAGRNLIWAGIAFAAGLVGLIYFLPRSIPLSFTGFLVMLFAALWFERNLRRMGKAGWYDVHKSLRDHGIPDAMSEAKQKLRDRFQHPE